MQIKPAEQLMYIWQCFLGFCPSNYLPVCFIINPKIISLSIIISYFPEKLKFSRSRHCSISLPAFQTMHIVFNSGFFYKQDVFALQTYDCRLTGAVAQHLSLI